MVIIPRRKEGKERDKESVYRGLNLASFFSLICHSIKSVNWHIVCFADGSAMLQS